jgi:hypothetical protein
MGMQGATPYRTQRSEENRRSVGKKTGIEGKDNVIRKKNKVVIRIK